MDDGFPWRRVLIGTLVIAVIGALLGALNNPDARLEWAAIGALVGAIIGFIVSAFPRLVAIILLALLIIVALLVVAFIAVSAVVVVLEAFGVDTGTAQVIAVIAVGGLAIVIIGRRLFFHWQGSSTGETGGDAGWLGSGDGGDAGGGD